MKPTLPYGSLPILDVIDDDDAPTPTPRTVTQSIAMLRYAGKLSGLYPMDADQALTVDEVIDVINNDVTPAMFGYRGDDRKVLQEHREKFVKDVIPRYVETLDRRMGEMMGEESAFVLGDDVSIADLMITNFVNGLKQGIIDFVPTDCVDHCEHLMRSYRSVMSIPQVKEWYQKYKIANVTEE